MVAAHIITPTTIWKAIPVTDSHYEVSNSGQVRRSIAARGSVAGRVLKPGRTKAGYLTVSLKTPAGFRTYPVHRLVAEAFVPKKGDETCVNHLNGHKYDNHSENLEWCDHARNNQHALDTGLNPNKGATHYSARNETLN